jgi:hypothetical protein
MNDQFLYLKLPRLIGISSIFRWCRLGAFCVFLTLTLSITLLAQGDLTNGGNHDGSITLDDQDIWAFSANEGDKIFVRAAQLSGGKSFAPRLRIYNEDGAQVGFSTGGASSNNSEGSVDYVASSSGDFTVAIDSGLADGTGTYRLYFLNIAESFIIPGGDHGGELTSGVNRDGSISVGDLDI